MVACSMRGRGQWAGLRYAAAVAAVVAVVGCPTAPEEPLGLIVPDAERIDVGEVYVGQRVTRPFSLRNVGDGRATLTGIVADVHPSLIVDAVTPLSIPAGEERSFTILFSPDAPGLVGGRLNLSFEADNLSETVVELGARAVPQPFCDDPGPCASTSFDLSIGGCVSAPAPDNTQCNDNSFCTRNDRCVSGICVGDDISGTCNDGNVCTLDRCDPQVGCVYPPDEGLCDDGNPCTADGCDPEAGCRSTPAFDGELCGPGETCAFERRCAAGACAELALEDGASCSDGNACSVDDACIGGSCVGEVPSGGIAISPIVPMFGPGRMAWDETRKLAISGGSYGISVWDVAALDAPALLGVLRLDRPVVGAPVLLPFQRVVVLLNGGEVAVLDLSIPEGPAELGRTDGVDDDGVQLIGAGGFAYRVSPTIAGIERVAIDGSGVPTLAPVDGWQASPDVGIATGADDEAGRIAIHRRQTASANRVDVFEVGDGGALTLSWSRTLPPGVACVPPLVVGDRVACVLNEPDGPVPVFMLHVLAAGTDDDVTHDLGPFSPTLAAPSIVGGRLPLFDADAERVVLVDLNSTTADTLAVLPGPELIERSLQSVGGDVFRASGGELVVVGDDGELTIHAPTQPDGVVLLQSGDELLLRSRRYLYGTTLDIDGRVLVQPPTRLVALEGDTRARGPEVLELSDRWVGLSSADASAGQPARLYVFADDGQSTVRFEAAPPSALAVTRLSGAGPGLLIGRAPGRTELFSAALAIDLGLLSPLTSVNDSIASFAGGSVTQSTIAASPDGRFLALRLGSVAVTVPGGVGWRMTAFNLDNPVTPQLVLDEIIGAGAVGPRLTADTLGLAIYDDEALRVSTWDLTSAPLPEPAGQAQLLYAAAFPEWTLAGPPEVLWYEGSRVWLLLTREDEVASAVLSVDLTTAESGTLVLDGERAIVLPGARQRAAKVGDRLVIAGPDYVVTAFPSCE